ncbi:hypothetical protein THOM_0468 [Trachipleistophora hominis]|uniref:Uncharacterized protein n=1 Tax=Trachipleistophora hominis TaxID=72359 RepID=L7JYZ9_TRAHO|nr:hypothetical protein THOM_0468 [Trachipleistophora hominis]
MYFVGEVKPVIKKCMDEFDEDEKNNFIDVVRGWLSDSETKFEKKHHSNSYNVIWQAVLQKIDEDENLFDVKAARDVMEHIIKE